MKNALFAAILAFAINAYTQNKQPILEIKYSKSNTLESIQSRMNEAGFATSGLNSGNNLLTPGKLQNTEQGSVIQLNDSIYRWQWDAIIPGWKIVYKTNSINYDANYNKTSEIEHWWDGNSWVIGTLLTQTYDANNNCISYLSKNWNGSGWVNYMKSNYTYDANNNVMDIITQGWIGNSWIKTQQETNTYDANNNLINYGFFYWYNGVLESASHVDYTYDADNNCIGASYQKWNGSAMVNDFRFTSTYDDNNNQISVLHQLWDGNVWIDDWYTTNIFDANNNQTSSIGQNWDGSAWVDGWINTFTYDANNNQTCCKYESWNGSAWVNGFQYAYTFDANNNQTSYTYQNWDGNTWVNSFQENKIFDADNFMKSKSEKMFNTTGTEVTSGDSTYYYFHTVISGKNDFPPQEENITLYPSPATNKITISANKLLPGEIRISIVSISGQQLILSRFQNQKQPEIDVSALSKGIYLVKIWTDKGIETKKLVIQ
jgi:hypothetical protein